MTDASGYVRENAPVQLGAVECRVIGAMIEKQFTTPDVYPMTTNALTSACNQKSNRDPVVAYDNVVIDNALLELRQRNLVRRVHTPGSRSTKHRQTLDEVLSVSDAELVVLSVLMLRGPQTVGELLRRTERSHGFGDQDAVYQCLQGLSGRSPQLVHELARQPGHKDTRWQHLIGDATEEPDTVAVEPSVAPTQPSPPVPRPTPASTTTPLTSPVQHAPSADADLVQKVAGLESEVAVLRRQLRGLAEQLGETLD